MTPEEMKKEFYELYDLMAQSNKVENMHVFGEVHKEMMEWFIQNKPEAAREWLEKLESIRWKNYLTPKEAEKIVANMEPSAPWSRDKWRTAMMEHDLEIEKEPCYNSCALWVTMNAIMSDSSETLSKYIKSDDLFMAVYELAVDKLMDADGKMTIREKYGL